MHFGENQLSPGSFGISPLSTGPPSRLQSTPVRPSTRSYPRFSLPMDSSPGFGSIPSDSSALFRLAFAAAPGATPLASPPRITRRSVLQKVRRQGTSPLRLVVGAGFQDLFHPPLPGCFSPFPHGTVRYRSARVPSLGGWSRRLPPGFRVSRRTHAPHRSPLPFAYGALTPCGGLFQWPSAKERVSHCAGDTPIPPCGRTTPCAQRRHPWHAHGLGLHRFARRYSGAILLPPGT